MQGNPCGVVFYIYDAGWSKAPDLDACELFRAAHSNNPGIILYQYIGMENF
jgi:hypothetical protein